MKAKGKQPAIEVQSDSININKMKAEWLVASAVDDIYI
jgi:hypothetical protein